MNRAGTIYDNDLFAEVADTTRRIRGIGQDSRLNLYMVNGTNRIYVRNQYINDIGISGIIHEVVMENRETGERDTLDFLNIPAWEVVDYIENELQGPWEPVNATIVEDADSIAQWSGAYLFYADSTVLTGVEFTDVDAGVNQSGKVYVTDRKTDRIIELTVRMLRAVMLENGEVAYTYRGEYEENLVVSFGQGQGSTNNPTSVVSEASGGSNAAVYYTQTSGNFLVQKVKGSGEEWFFDLTVAPSGEPEVLRLEYFESPQAIALAEKDERGLGLFFVADSAQNRVPAFHANGFLFREVAVDELLLDLETGDSLLAVIENMGMEFHVKMNLGVSEDFIAPSDTTLSILYPILNGPKGVATIEGVVYISDTGNNRILRFKRSDSTSYLPDEGE